MSADVFKEFLVALGFKVDAAGLKRFNDGVAKATKVVGELGAATTAAAVTVEAAVVKVSQGFEDLYYASQRIGASVVNIKAADYAFSQMGGSAQGARAALENIAEFMRSNPGGERFIAGLGVSTRGANGELRDTSEILSQLGDRFRAMPYYAAKVRANMLGIDERTLQALIRGTDQFSARYRAMAQRYGVDQDAAAKASHDFMVQVRDLGAQLELMFGKIVLSLQGPAGNALKNFAETGMRVLEGLGLIALRLITGLGELDRVTGGWSTTLIALLAVLGPLLMILDPIVLGVLAVGAAITALIDDFQTWRAGGTSLIDWSQWSDEIDAAIAGFQNLGEALGELWGIFKPFAAWLVKALGPVLSSVLKAGLALITGEVNFLADGLRVIVDILTGQWSKAWGDARKMAHDTIGSMIADAKAGGNVLLGLGNLIPGGKMGPGSSETPAGATGASAQARAAALAGQGGAAGLGGGKGLGQQALAYFQSQGWTREQAAGLVANLAAESGFNHQAVGDGGRAFGLAQWHGDRQAEFKRLFGKDIRQASFMEQLQFVQHELTRGAEKTAGRILKGARTAAESAALVSRYYERPADLSGQALVRGRMAENWYAQAPLAPSGGKGSQVAINQQTTVHVHGADGHAAGRAVAAEQERVNGNLVRNTKGAVA